MKTMNINKVSLFFVLGFLCITLNGNSQDVKLSKQERKEVRKAQLAANFAIMDSLLASKSFVLEADNLIDKYGHMVPVVSMLNFIKVENSKGVLQTGTSSELGYNGVGGVTAEGSIGVWSVTKDFKRLMYNIHFTILTNLGAFDVFMYVTADNNASATITGSGPGKLTWKGHLSTVNNSRVYKGQNSN
jgi:hypothetical protein